MPRARGQISSNATRIAREAAKDPHDIRKKGTDLAIALLGVSVKDLRADPELRLWVRLQFDSDFRKQVEEYRKNQAGR